MGLKEKLGCSLPLPVARAARAGWHRVVRMQFLGRLIKQNVIDTWRFFRWSHDGLTDRQNEQRLNALVKAYHGIEKGLSLAVPRPGFGQVKARQLIRRIDDFADVRPMLGPVLSAIASLEEYRQFNEGHGVVLPWVDDWLERTQQTIIRSTGYDAYRGGSARVIKADILKAVSGTGPEFFLSRHSMRQFGPEKVAYGDIGRAVMLAQKAPSACNRQGPRVHCFSEPMTALQHQPGNAGFGHLASHALVMTSDFQTFCTSGERHQTYVDGGIFAMALVHALHSLGYGSCMLSWNASPDIDRQTKRVLQISESEVIIMMIAVGTLPDDFHVAISARRPLKTVLYPH